jgi:polysaccharide biosynthesis transport protein
MKQHRNVQESPYEIFSIFAESFMRYWKVSIAPAIVLFGLIAVLTIHLPNYYTSDALIFIQPQRISSRIIDTPDTQTMLERLESLVQEILSRPRLRSVLERFNLYPDLRGPIGMEKATIRFRKQIKINPIVSPSSGVNLLQTFQLSFDHQDPKMAYEITKALTNLFIEESIVDRRSEVQGTEEFLDAQLEEARRTLESTENQVQEFVRQNFTRLPEQLAGAIARLENLRAQFAANNEHINANTIRQTNLKRELDNLGRVTTGAMDNTTDTVVGSTNPAEALAQLQAALVVLTSRYSERHPDVVATRNRIETLKSQLGQGGNARTGNIRVGDSAAAIRLRRELSEVEITLTSLVEENSRIKEQLTELENDIQQMPIIEQELLKIKRDYVNVRENYDRLLAAKQDASLQSSLIRSQKATQFRIVEPAELPVLPSGPNRLLIAFLGTLAAIGITIGLPLLLYFLNRAYKSTNEVEQEIGLPVIGVVPPMQTLHTAMLEKRLATITVITSAFSLVGGSVMILLIV